MSEPLAKASRSAGPVRFAEVAWGARRDTIEYCWVDGAAAGAPLLLFLHEGLGSLAMWKVFPEQLCAASGCRGLVFSRWGYGASSPRPAALRWSPHFMHEQAREFLPAFLETLGIDAARTPPWIYGHSDGASIALIHAASFPERVAGLIVAAPHVFVEPVSVASIARTRAAYLAGDLRTRLARYHADPDSAFWGWNDIWLDPAFRTWNIEALLPSIRCPLLAVQGIDDEYGTLEQIERIGAAVAGAELLKLPDCAHAPHRDQCDSLIAAVTDFLGRHPRPGAAIP